MNIAESEHVRDENVCKGPLAVVRDDEVRMVM